MWEKAKREKAFKKLALFLNRKGAWLELLVIVLIGQEKSDCIKVIWGGRSPHDTYLGERTFSCTIYFLPVYLVR